MNSIRLRSRLCGLAGAAFLAVSGSAAAVPTSSYTSTGDFANLWSYSGTGSEGGTPISGDAYWDLYSDTDGDFFVFSLVNTSNDGSEIDGFAWNFPGDSTFAQPVNTYSSLGWDFVADASLPGNLQFDACATGKEPCTSAAGTGVKPGDDFNLFWVQYAPAAMADAWSEVDSCMRFGSVGADGEDSGVACRGEPPSVEVAAPATLLLFGLGLLGIGWGAGRRSS